MSFNWRRPFRSRDDDDTDTANGAGNVSDTDPGVLSDGSLQFTLEKGGNDSKPSYQEASGAPVERDSPLGYEVGPVTIIFLNISTMIGTGVYSTRMLSAFFPILDLFELASPRLGNGQKTRSKTGYQVYQGRRSEIMAAHMVNKANALMKHVASAILGGTGSVGLAMIFWTLGFFTSLSKLAVYLEFAAYFPNRSGGEVAYLEQVRPSPNCTATCDPPCRQHRILTFFANHRPIPDLNGSSPLRSHFNRLFCPSRLVTL